MSIHPTDFLDSAKKLLGNPDETSTRNAISRAYYAAYHLARSAYPPDAEFAKANAGGVHATFIDQLVQAEPGSPERLAGVKLGTLKGRRTKADYVLDCNIKPYVAAMQIQEAEALGALIESHQQHEASETNTSGTNAQTSKSCQPKLQRVQ